jgi:hypothetical protein
MIHISARNSVCNDKLFTLLYLEIFCISDHLTSSLLGHTCKLRIEVRQKTALKSILGRDPLTSSLVYKSFRTLSQNQCCGSGSESRRAKMTQKKKKKKKNSCFEVLDVFLWTKGFSCRLYILYEGLGIS